MHTEKIRYKQKRRHDNRVLTESPTMPLILGCRPRRRTSAALFLTLARPGLFCPFQTLLVPAPSGLEQDVPRGRPAPKARLPLLPPKAAMGLPLPRPIRVPSARSVEALGLPKPSEDMSHVSLLSSLNRAGEAAEAGLGWPLQILHTYM